MEFNEAYTIAAAWEEQTACGHGALVARALFAEMNRRALLLQPQEPGAYADLVTDLRELIDLHSWAYTVVGRAADALDAVGKVPQPQEGQALPDDPYVKIDYEAQLLPCPMCGSKDVSFCGMASPNEYTWAKCESCGTHSQKWDRFDKTIAMWNRRVSPSPAVAQPTIKDGLTVAETPPDTAIKRSSTTAAVQPVAFREVAADGTAITDWIDGSLPSNTPPLHPGATIQFAYGEPAAEPIAWEATTPVYAKYITDARYQALHPGFKPWFKPYRCSQCSARAANAAQASKGGAS